MTKYIYLNDDIRMYRADRFNIILEQLTTGINNKTKEATENWRVLAYCRNYRHAVEYILKYDNAIDDQKVKDLNDYLTEMKRVEADVKRLAESVRE